MILNWKRVQSRTIQTIDEFVNLINTDVYHRLGS